MNNKITNYSTLESLVEYDNKEHRLKEIATLFLDAMKGWPTFNQYEIKDFIFELKEFFGSPLTSELIDKKKYDGLNAWNHEAGISIANMIDFSTKYCNQSDFDLIIENILQYYNNELNIIDFIGVLDNVSAEQIEKYLISNSKLNLQMKFEITEILTFGQITFLDRKTVFPTNKIVVKIKLESPEHFYNSLKDDMDFELIEDTNIIAFGKIYDILNENLKTRV